MPVGFVFDVERIGRLRRAPQTVAGTLDVPHPSGRERRIRTSDDWRVRGFRLESRVLDEEGVPTGKRIRTAAMVVVKDPVSGERKPTRAVLTVVGWQDVVVYGTEPLGRYRALEQADALLCGYQTLEGLRAAWRGEHPSAAIARLYRFMLGDRRERTVWMYSGAIVAGRQGEYTTNGARALDRDAPLLTDQELEPLTMAAQQRDVARRAKISAEFSSGTLAERVARLAR